MVGAPDLLIFLSQNKSESVDQCRYRSISTGIMLGNLVEQLCATFHHVTGLCVAIFP
jgi:hypothetical protein